jgi:hypothetical protein
MSAEHQYYQHICRACLRTTYDALPMLVCPICLSPEVIVQFDQRKRAAVLAALTGTRVAADLSSTCDRPPSY